MNITIIGSGYVGLVTGACFAEMGHRVICMDRDHHKIEQLKRGHLPIYEPNLQRYVDRNMYKDRLTFTTDLPYAVTSSQALFLCLPTPPDGNGSADLSYVRDVVGNIAGLIRSYTLIVTKSTVPVGTADEIHSLLTTSGLTAREDFDVVSNPEFLREGMAVEDFLKPERVVVGTSSERATERMQHLYQPFVRNGNPIIMMDLRSAELTKYAANAFLATKISFMNEIAVLCDRLDANVDQVRLGIGKDSRIGHQFLYAGIGFGGSCFPKDTRALLETARASDYNFNILEAVMQVNRRQRLALISFITNYFQGNLHGQRLAVWGLSFKPNTDDIREAPALEIIQILLDAGVDIVAYDPEAIPNTRGVLGDSIEYAMDPFQAATNTDGLIICTEWPEFRDPDFVRLKQQMNHPVIFDGRNLYDPLVMEETGFAYYSIGRPATERNKKDYKAA